MFRWFLILLWCMAVPAHLVAASFEEQRGQNYFP